MRDIIVEYECDLNSKELGISFSIKFQTTEKNPPGPAYGKVHLIEDIYLEERELNRVGEV